MGREAVELYAGNTSILIRTFLFGVDMGSLQTNYAKFAFVPLRIG